MFDQPALGRKIQAATTPATSTTAARTGRTNALQGGCRWISTCSSLVSTLSGKPTPTSCRHNVRCDGSRKRPVWGSAVRLSDMNDVTGGDRGGPAVRAGHHQPAGTVHIGRLPGERGAVRHRDGHRPTEGRAMQVVCTGQATGLRVPGYRAPAVVPAGEGTQQGAQQRVAVGTRGAGEQQRGRGRDGQLVLP